MTTSSRDSDSLADTLIERLMTLFNAPSYKPPPPPEVALRLVDLANRGAPDVPKIVALLEQDPLLAAQVLRVTRSPLYSGRMPIQTLKEAVIRLGISNLRDVAMEATLSVQLFQNPEHAQVMNRLRQHSIVTGHVARQVCRATAIHPELAFLCGLLHDIGAAGAFLAATAKGEPKYPAKQLWQAIDRVHHKASQIIVKLWKLPVEIETVVGLHHEWNSEGTTHPMGAIVCVAHSIAEKVGQSFVPVPGEPALDLTPEPVLAAAKAFLELSPETYNALCANAEQTADACRPNTEINSANP